MPSAMERIGDTALGGSSGCTRLCSRSDVTAIRVGHGPAVRMGVRHVELKMETHDDRTFCVNLPSGDARAFLEACRAQTRGADNDQTVVLAFKRPEMDGEQGTIHAMFTLDELHGFLEDIEVAAFHS